jgi:F0F1-type ATP synthase delta subunit
VDARIVGGLIVEVGDKFVDMSLATRIKNMTKSLLVPI